MTNYVPRWQSQTINKVRKQRRVLLLTGPRQCGKTTLVKQLDSRSTEFRTLDDGTLRQAADADPQAL